MENRDFVKDRIRNNILRQIEDGPVVLGVEGTDNDVFVWSAVASLMGRDDVTVGVTENGNIHISKNAPTLSASVKEHLSLVEN
jgi:hypothetical protein